MNTRTTFSLAALVGLGLVAAYPAAANTTIYNFEIKDSHPLYNGTGVLAGSSTTWNVINTPVTNALDSNGAASSLGFSAQIGGTFSSPGAVGATTDPASLLSNVAYGSSASNQIHFTGLNPNSAYTLALFGINGSYANNSTFFAITQSDYSTQINSATTTHNNYTFFNYGDNYVQFTGTADATGQVYGIYNGEFNGAQINASTPDAPSAAPEPSQFAALTLTGLGVLGMVLKARKRKTMGAAA